VRENSVIGNRVNAFLKQDQRWIVALTGASGICYGLRLIEVLSALKHEVHVIFSEAALRVMQEEQSSRLSQSSLSFKRLFPDSPTTEARVVFHSPKDIAAAPASGTYHFDGMVIAPCSMSTLGAVAHGIPTNLIHRAADVTLKEGRKLVVVPRETPLSAIHLENMLKLSRLGVSITPAMPGFYHKPTEIIDLIDMLVMKILDQIGIRCDLVQRWGETTTAENMNSQSLRMVLENG